MPSAALLFRPRVLLQMKELIELHNSVSFMRIETVVFNLEPVNSARSNHFAPIFGDVS